jgi:hypothetical protein
MSRLNRSKNRLERQTDESAHGHFAAWSAPQSCRGVNPLLRQLFE